MRHGQLVMLKLTLPEKDDLYAEFVSHPKVVKVVALSGGYTRDECNRRLRRNHGVVASVSRALVEGAVGPANRCRLQRHAGCVESEHLRCVQHVRMRATDLPTGGVACARLPGTGWRQGLRSGEHRHTVRASAKTLADGSAWALPTAASFT